MLKRLTSSPAFLSGLGWLGASYIRFVYRTSRVLRDPANTDETLFDMHPLICTTWHGQFFVTPLIKPRSGPMDVHIMIARHGDAEVVAEVIKRFDMHPLRGAGAGGRKRDRGGAKALRALLDALKTDKSVMMTAEVPPGPARQAGRGLITAARLSGRPIVPCATVTGRFLTLDTWSRFTISLPFSKLAIVVGEPIWVSADADKAEMEFKRQEVTAALNEVTDRAYLLAGGDPERSKPLNQAASAQPGLGLKLYGALSKGAERLAPTILRWRRGRGKETADRIEERQGVPSLPRPPGQLVWFHAASVGETNATLPLIEALEAERPDLAFLLTTGTVTSGRIAKARAPRRVIHQFIPLDGPRFMAKFFAHWQPALGVLAESEIWPNMVLAADAADVPLVLVNARISRQSYRRWRRLKSIARPLFGRIDHILTQNPTFARQFMRLGGRNVTTVGNLKIDAPAPPADADALAELRSAIGPRPVFLAASTHAGEEEFVAAAHLKIAEGHPRLLTIIVPRHPQRAEAIAKLLDTKGLKWCRRSDGELPGPDCDIYVADTIGELGLFFGLRPVTFVGGSLVPHGGQNPIEAVKHGAAVLTGPHHGNFADAYGDLIKRDACLLVEGATDLVRDVQRLLGDAGARSEMSEKASIVVERLSGALPKTLAVLREALPPEAEIKRAS